MKRVALVGRGYVGGYFYKALRARDYAVDVLGRDYDFEYAIRRSDLVINAAGYGGDRNVDDCNTNRGRTVEDNVMLPLRLRDLCMKMARPIIHVSSGCVFNGNRMRKGKLVPWTEGDPPNFTFNNPSHSFYTGTKFMSEQILLGHMSWICRIRMPFGKDPHPHNLITKLARYPIIVSAMNSMTDIEEGVGAMINLYEKRAPYGIYHVVNDGAMDTYNAYRMIRRKFEVADNSADPETFYSPLMKEPRSNTWLSSDKLARVGIPMRSVVDAFKDCLK